MYTFKHIKNTRTGEVRNLKNEEAEAILEKIFNFEYPEIFETEIHYKSERHFGKDGVLDYKSTLNILGLVDKYALLFAYKKGIKVKVKIKGDYLIDFDYGQPKLKKFLSSFLARKQISPEQFVLCNDGNPFNIKLEMEDTLKKLVSRPLVVVDRFDLRANSDNSAKEYYKGLISGKPQTLFK